jgi:hypothetical protein
MGNEPATTPASFAQRSMWAASIRNRDPGLNVFILRWKIEGQLNAELLRQAIRDLFDRHQTMRSKLVMQAGQLLQVLDSPSEPIVEQVEVSGSTMETRFERAAAVTREIGRAGLSLSSGPLAKVFLLRLNHDLHMLCFVVHHAICDGWSSQILIRDLVSMYGAKSSAIRPCLPDLAEHYSDFSRKQFEIADAGGFADELEYWRTELKDLPPAISLPSSRPRKGLRNIDCQSKLVIEGLDVLAALRQAARSRHVTVFSFLFAILVVLLYQRTKSDDLIVGVSTLNRWSQASLHFVGCATSLLPVRILLNKEMGFDHLCAAVHGKIREMLTYGRVPLELIMRDIRSSSPAASIEMPIWCQFREAGQAITVDKLGLVITSLEIERATLQCEIEVDWLGTNTGLRCEYAYRPALFGASEIDAVAGEFVSMLHAVLCHGDMSISSLIEVVGH